MAIARPLGLILGMGALLGAATSQAIPTRLAKGGDRPWATVNPERYPEIVAVTYDLAPGAYYAPRAYSAVEPIIPVGPWDELPADDDVPGSDPDGHLDAVPWEAAHLSADHPEDDAAVNVPEEAHDDSYGNEHAADQEADNGVPEPAGA